jgi:hypothetical protein
VDSPHGEPKRKEMLGILFSLFRSDSTEDSTVVGGSNAVFDAILENAGADKRYRAEFGEPQLIDRGGQFSTQHMVRIPTETPGDDPDPPNVEYDLPGSEMGEDDNELFDLLSLYGIEQVDDLADLEGKSVPVGFENGVPTLQFNELQQEAE